MAKQAWVTLATNDSYALGALVLAHSLRRVNSAYPAVVLITPSVSEVMRGRLSTVFVEVVTVDVLDSRDAAHLALLARPELGITFTKIHCWSLTQYDKCVFLDADTLMVQNSDELFEREELSAAPDVGWPDCFNSGVFVFKPSETTFNSLLEFAKERGSFDGGDQGLLNSFFSSWAHGDINKHLPFLYNVTSVAFYSYLPALKEFGQGLKIIHFIGNAKPWLQNFNWESRTVDAAGHVQPTLQLWWNLFVSEVHPQLEESMTGLAGTFARLTLGPASSQQAALDEHTRRQGWEAGNIDYLGADSFDKIWAKISATLAQPPQAPESKHEEPKTATPESASGEVSTDAALEPATTGAPTPAPTATASAPASNLSPVLSLPEPAPITETKSAPVDDPKSLPLNEPIVASLASSESVPMSIAPSPTSDPASETCEKASELSLRPSAPVTESASAPSPTSPVVSAETAKAAPTDELSSTPESVPLTSAQGPVTELAEPMEVKSESLVASVSAVIPEPEAIMVAAPADASVTAGPAAQSVPIAETTPVPSETKKTEEPSVTKDTESPQTPVVEPSVETPVIVAPVTTATPPSTPKSDVESSPESPAFVTPEKDAPLQTSTDSPPLLSTPVKEPEATKSNEEGAQETRL